MFLFLDTVLDDIETAYLANLRTALLFNPVTRDVLWLQAGRAVPTAHNQSDGGISVGSPSWVVICPVSESNNIAVNRRGSRLGAS